MIGWRLWAILLMGLALVFGEVSVRQAAKSSKKLAPANSAELESQWNDVGRKLTAMAEDFPEEKYGFKPVPTVRSFSEQLLHMAGSNYLFTNVALGQAPPGPESESPEKFRTKAEVVAYVKKSFADGAAAIRAKGDAGMNEPVKDPESGKTVSLLGLAYSLAEHSGEHYGQLVMYYRFAGMVPPESRPK